MEVNGQLYTVKRNPEYALAKSCGCALTLVWRREEVAGCT
jgi:hypothetical protein